MAKNKLSSAFSKLSWDSPDQSSGTGLLTQAVEFRQIEVENIRPNPDQPRQTFSDESLEELKNSISEKGLLQAVLVTPEPGEFGRYVLVAGERRWRASKLAGLSVIPALVRENVDALELAIIENLQRENLHPLEEAEGLLKLKTRHQYTDEQLAEVLGKSRPSVSELLALTKLSEPIKQECRTFDQASKIQLLQVVKAKSEEEQQQLWDAVKSGSSVRHLKSLTKRQSQKPPKMDVLQFKHPGVTLTIRSKTGTPRETILELIAQADEQLRSAPLPSGDTRGTVR